MIKRAAKALLIQSSNGQCASFSSARLREDLSQAFVEAGCREDWMWTAIADTVEDYVLLHAESAAAPPLSTADLTRLVLRILAETGLHDVADCYRRQRSANSASGGVGCGSEWDRERVLRLLKADCPEAQREESAAAVVSSLRQLGLSRVTDELICELARHVGAVKAAVPASPRPQPRGGVLLSCEQQILCGGAPFRHWSQEAVVGVLPVRSLLPTVRVTLSMDQFCRLMGQPLTELLFLPRLRRLVADVKDAVGRIRGEVLRRVPHAAAYPARITVLRLDEAVEAGMGAPGAAAVRLSAEARTVLERGLAGGPELPLAVKYSQAERDASRRECAVSAEALLPA